MIRAPTLRQGSFTLLTVDKTVAFGVANEQSAIWLALKRAFPGT